MKIYYCKHCKNVVTYLEDKGVLISCCGEEMEELIANTTDGSGEKHVPVISINGSKVNVKIGEVAHPMTDEHYISFIIVETNLKNSIYKLNDKPEITFTLEENEEILNVYEYCNLHGLWKTN